jgi:hypothetical protein
MTEAVSRRSARRPGGRLAVVVALVTGLALGGLALAGAGIPLADDFRGAVGELWSLRRIRASALAFVDDPGQAGRPVLAITLQPGDLAQAAGTEMTERAELSEKPEVMLGTDTDVWYRLSLQVPGSFPVLDRRLVLAQWKQECGDCSLDHSPAVAVRYRKGALSVTVDNPEGRRTVVQEGRDIRGRWIDLLFHLRVTPTADGLVEVWLDGHPVGAYRGPVGFPDDLDRVYFKMGLYRDHLQVPMTLLVRSFRRGASRAEVAATAEP